MFRHLARILSVVALGTVLATAALTAPAIAQEETPIVTASLTGNATLVAKGAAVDVQVLYSCSADATSAFLNVFNLTQRVGGGRLANGSGSTDGLVCDSAEHLATVLVIADGGFAFKKGDAVAQGSFQACNPFCSFVPFSGTVRIH